MELEWFGPAWANDGDRGMATYETLTRKADELLKRGDEVGGAEGRKLHRKCRHYRRLARAAKNKRRDRR